MKSRVIAVGLFLVGAGVLPSVAVSAQVGDEIQEREVARFERAAATGTDLVYEGWGKFSVAGDYGAPRVLPGTRMIVTDDLANDRGVVYDFDTNELSFTDSSDPQCGPGGFSSSDGESTYRVEFSDDVSAVDGTIDRVVEVWRCSAIFQQLQERFSVVYREGVASLPLNETLSATAIPGTSERIVIVAGDSVHVIEEGVLLPDSQLTPILPVGFKNFVAFEDGSVYVQGLGQPRVIRIQVVATGVAGVDQVLDGEIGRLTALDDESFLVGDTRFGHPGLADRPASNIELSTPDPDLDLRFGGVGIVDEQTGNVLPPGRPCDGGGIPIGNGWVVNDDLVFTNVLDRCGAYGEFTAVQPDRVFDSRPGNGEPGAGQPLRGGEVRRVRIHGLGGVPFDGVESVVLNVTAINQRGAAPATNYLTVWPAGFDQPTVANVNLGDGATVGNMVTVSTADSGFIEVYSDVGTVDLTVDVVGYFASSIAPAAARFRAFEPYRRFDSRREDGQLQGVRVRQGETITLDMLRNFSSLRGRISGDGELVDREDITAVVMSVTAVQPTERGFLRISPTGSPIPDASAMNFEPDTNTNRLVTVAMNDGEVDIRNELGTTHLTVDVVGFYVDGIPTAFTAAGPAATADLQNGRFVGYVPFRTIDTRVSSPFDGNGRIPENFQLIQGGWGVGSTLVTNLTAVRPTETGFFSTLQTPPITTSALNFGPGDIIANQSLILVSDDGEISVFNSAGLAHFTLDVFGAYTETDAQAAANPPL